MSEFETKLVKQLVKKLGLDTDVHTNQQLIM
jgi:hypothetical protein